MVNWQRLTKAVVSAMSSGFEGIYVWNSHGAIPGHTVELRTPELKLRPGTGVEFSYLIR